MSALFVTPGASGTAVGSTTVTAPSTLTKAGHGFTAGQQVATYAPEDGAAGVLVPGAPYYVASPTTDTFELRASPGGPVMVFADAGTVAVAPAEGVYTPQVLRESFGGLYFKGRAVGTGRFGARSGVLQNGSSIEVSVSGLRVTVTDLNCIINSYLCAIPTHFHDLSPAHPSLDRVDLLVGEVLDDAADSSGDLIPGRTRIIEGVLADGNPVAPTAPPGTLELGEFKVLRGASSASGKYTALFTVAAGGVLPVRDASELPAGNVRDGMCAYQADIEALMCVVGGQWEVLAYAGFPEPVVASNNALFSGLTNTTPAATLTPVGLAFVAPPTGRGLLVCSARVTLAITGTVDRIALGTPWLGTGSTVNAGTAVAIEGVTTPDDSLAFVEARNASNTTETHCQARNSETYVVTGLTPGALYNVALRYRVTSASSASYTVDRQKVRWVPQR